MSPVRNHGRETLPMFFEVENHREGSCTTACRKEFLLLRCFEISREPLAMSSVNNHSRRKFRPVRLRCKKEKPLPNRDNAGRFGRACVGTTGVQQIPRNGTRCHLARITVVGSFAVHA